MNLDIEAHSHGKRHRLRDAADMFVLLCAIAATVYFWPAALGGDTRLIVVEGHSMEPTFHLGDIVIVRDNPHPTIGDIIVYHIPKGDAAAGMLIIHRVKSIRADGSFETQGDNRTTADPFDVRSTDIVGSPVLAVPHAGRLIGLTSNPVAVGLSAGLLTVLLLWPKKHGRPAPEIDTLDAPAPDEYESAAHDFDADAEAWLREQLSLHQLGDVHTERDESARLLGGPLPEVGVHAR